MINKILGKAWNAFKKILCHIDKWGTFLMTLAALIVAIFAYNIAENTYKHDGANYRANITIEKVGDIIHIKNQDADLFDLESINIEKRERYYVDANDNNTRIEFLTMYYDQYIGDDNIDTLNDVKIDVNIINNSNISQNDTVLFKNMYEISLKRLQEKYNIHYQKTVFYINITYFNKHTYEDNTLQLMAFLEKDGTIKRFYPLSNRNDRHTFIPLATEYEFINDSWDIYIEEINRALGLFNRQLTIEDEVRND